MRRSDARRAGAAVADVVMVIAGLALLVAALAPTLRARSFRALVEDAATDVETLRSASEQYFAANRAWPTPGEPGSVPPEVATAFPGRASLDGDDYVIQWRVLEMLEEREVARTADPLRDAADATPDSVGPDRESVPIDIGGIVLRSSDDELLAELLARFGTESSFVRDSTWTLVVGTTPGG